MTNYDSKSPFARAFMTAVFIGIMDTLICLVFNVVYRSFNGFPLSAIFNVSVLIFAVNLLFMVIGLVYFAFIKAFKRGDIVYMIVFAGLTALSIWKGYGTHRSDDPEINTQFHGLLAGMILIMGISASFFLPYFYHSKKFEEHVL